MSIDHPDIEKLPLETDGVPVRETIREIFRNPENGTPDNISKVGCFALAEKGANVWNAWRTTFETIGSENLIKGFENKVNFERYDFDPDHISWLVPKDFRYFVFGHSASFWNAKFRHVNFDNAKFGFGTRFDNASFSNKAVFSNACFCEFISFANTKFDADTFFNGVRFEGDVNFSADTEDAKKVSALISFEDAVFCGAANFNGRRFSASTVFKNTKFTKPPTFHGCELHQDTSFEGAQFPPFTGSEESIRAYRTLKLAFSKQQAIREEQRFFRLEMEEEALRETGLKRWLFWAYRIFSDYGFSITRPLTCGGLAVLVLTLIYGFLSWAGQCSFGVGAGCTFSPQWIEFSLLQTLPLPGLDKLSEASKAVFWPKGAWWDLGLSALVILHKTISLVALFLIVMALRNLFKLK